MPTLLYNRLAKFLTSNMTIYAKPHTIEVYTLAESAVLVALLQNALGYAAEPTFGAPIIEKENFKNSLNFVNATLEDLLARAETASVRLCVKRIFKPLKASAFPQYNRHYHDDGMRNPRILLEKHPDILSFTATDDLQEDLGVLLRDSPPLYDKLFTSGILLRQPTT